MNGGVIIAGLFAVGSILYGASHPWDIVRGLLAFSISIFFVIGLWEE